MTHRTVLLFMLAVAGIAACAQGSGYGYPGPRRGEEEVATIRGSRLDITGNTFGVSITTIDGAASHEGWSGPASSVDVLPGDYTIGVDARWEAPSGLYFMIVRLFADAHPREIPLSVRSGHTYAIAFDYDGKYYMIRDVPYPNIASARFPEETDPSRCDLALTDRDREICGDAVERAVAREIERERRRAEREAAEESGRLRRRF